MKKPWSRFFVKGTCVLVLSTLGVASMLTSCHDDMEENKKEPEQNENPSTPTDDQLTVKYNQKAVVFGSERSKYDGAISDRMIDMQNVLTENAKAIIYTTNSAKQLSDEDARILAIAYANKANVVFVSPKTVNATDMAKSLRTAIAGLTSEGYDVSLAKTLVRRLEAFDELTKDENLAVVGFRDNSVYVINSLEAKTDNNKDTFFCVNPEDSETDKKNILKELNESPIEYTAYQYGLSSDRLVNWMMTDDGPRKSVGADSSSIDDIMKGTYMHVQWSLAKPTRALDREFIWEADLFLYSAYDFNNNRDYYFVRIDPNFRCSMFQCVQNSERDWIYANHIVTFDDGETAGDTWDIRRNCYYGPYLVSWNPEMRIYQQGNNHIIDPMPKTDISGSSTYTTGVTFTLAGNYGFALSNGPSAGLNGSVTFSNTKTMQQNNMKIQLTEESSGGLAQWQFSGMAPLMHESWMKWIYNSNYHDQVYSFQKNDWQSEISGILMVDNPIKDEKYKLYFYQLLDIRELSYDGYQLGNWTSRCNLIALDRPNRFKENYVMNCSNEALLNNVRNQLGENWMDVFTFYAQDDYDLNSGVLEMFDRAKQIIIGKADILYQQGYTGVYTFTLRKNGSTENISAFELRNGKVVDLDN